MIQIRYITKDLILFKKEENRYKIEAKKLEEVNLLIDKRISQYLHIKHSRSYLIMKLWNSERKCKSLSQATFKNWHHKCG